MVDAVVSTMIKKGDIPNYRTPKSAKEHHRILGGCGAVKANAFENPKATEKPDGSVDLVRP
jgi:hypothetical protein